MKCQLSPTLYKDLDPLSAQHGQMFVFTLLKSTDNKSVYSLISYLRSMTLGFHCADSEVRTTQTAPNKEEAEDIKAVCNEDVWGEVVV